MAELKRKELATMAKRFDELNPPERILLGPGPSNVPPRVLRAMSAPCIGHLDPEFLRVMDETQELLRFVFQTENRLTIPVSGTGSAGMETCFVNLVEPGDRVVIGVNGVFGTRMVDNARRLGAEVIPVEAPWGEPISPKAVEEVLKRNSVKMVAVVHAETSTGVLQPLQDIEAMAHRSGALFVVDTVTSLGGAAVQVDAWRLDAVYSGTQKCLSCPPGLAPLTLNSWALEVLENRKHPVSSWYLDMGMVKQYWGAERVYHHTAPVNMIYGLREALRIIHEEGLDRRFTRHLHNHMALVAGVEGLGLEMHVAEGFRLPTLNTVQIPSGVDDLKVRRALLDRFQIEIGGGLGALKGKIWRVGLMGHSSSRGNVILFLEALGTLLKAEGAVKDAGAGVSAAMERYASWGD
jgi:alanine-glyoxylate transaminase/serine-glyoxylate transaminase/serine-pyruvate transaminase